MGEIADWVCAKNAAVAEQGNFIIAEAKGDIEKARWISSVFRVV